MERLHVLGHEVVVTHDPKGNEFVATVTDLPGCVARGKSRSEVLAEVAVAIRQSLDCCS